MKKIETYEETAEELKKKVGYIEVSVENLITILQYILEIVELTKKKGPQKKTLAITLLKQLIDESEANVIEKDDCYIMINNGTISNTIDLVISASKKKTKLNKYKSIVKRILHKYNISKQARSLQQKMRRKQKKTSGKKPIKNKNLKNTNTNMIK